MAVSDVGEWMANDTRIPLLSATGSTRMGKAVGAAVGARLGRALLGTWRKQCDHYFKRCRYRYGDPWRIVWSSWYCRTTVHINKTALIIHDDVYENVKQKLIAAYSQLHIGNPLDENNHVGPLIDKDAVKMYEACN